MHISTQSPTVSDYSDSGFGGRDSPVSPIQEESYEDVRLGVPVQRSGVASSSFSLEPDRPVSGLTSFMRDLPSRREEQNFDLNSGVAHRQDINGFDDGYTELSYEPSVMKPPRR
jgi:hypothetical protein